MPTTPAATAPTTMTAPVARHAGAPPVLPLELVCVLELVLVLPPLVTVLVPLVVLLLSSIFITVLLELVIITVALDPPRLSALADARIALAALPVAVSKLAPLMRVSKAEAMSALMALARG